MVSSIGKVVLSGKMQVERHDTSFCTPRLWHSWKMLSFMLTLSLQNCTLCFMLAKKTAHLGREVDHVGRLILIEDGSHRGGVAEVTVL